MKILEAAINSRQDVSLTAYLQDAPGKNLET